MCPDLAISREALEAERWPALVLDHGGRIVRVNQAWDRIAAGASGPVAEQVLGTCCVDHIEGQELRGWYEALFARVLRVGERETHICDCNTPDRYRLFSTCFAPLRSERSGEWAGVLVLTTLMDEGAIGERYRIGPPDELRYLCRDGLIRQCSDCRRVRIAGSSPPEWEIVPEYVPTPRHNVSHGLCKLCRELYYGISVGGAS
jgi:hypothetical protein